MAVESAAETSEPKFEALPVPRKFLSRDSRGVYVMEPFEFFRYWSGLTSDQIKRVSVYPYRILPVVDNTQSLSLEELEAIRQRKKRRPPTNLGLLVDPISAESWAQDVASRWGAGDYKFLLNDQHPSVKKTICSTFTDGEAPLRDWDSYPPVLEIPDVVLNDKSNRAYIRWAHLHNIYFPGEPQAPPQQPEESEDEMANQVVVEKLLDKAFENSASQSRASDLSAVSAGKTLEVMADAAKQGQQIMSQAMKSANEIASNVQDPAKYFENVMAAAEKIAPKDSGGGGMVPLLMQMLQASDTRHLEEMRLADTRHAREMEFLQKRLESNETLLREQQSRMLAAAQTPPVVQASSSRAENSSFWTECST